jgi:hypothetical protein
LLALSAWDRVGYLGLIVEYFDIQVWSLFLGIAPGERGRGKNMFQRFLFTLDDEFVLLVD